MTETVMYPRQHEYPTSRATAVDKREPDPLEAELIMMGFQELLSTTNYSRLRMYGDDYLVNTNRDKNWIIVRCSRKETCAATPKYQVFNGGRKAWESASRDDTRVFISKILEKLNEETD